MYLFCEFWQSFIDTVLHQREMTYVYLHMLCVQVHVCISI